MKYASNEFPADTDLNKLQVAYWNGSTWDIVDGTVDTSARTITFSTNHFSVFGVLYPGIIAPIITTARAATPLPTTTTGVSIPLPFITPKPKPVFTPTADPPAPVVWTTPVPSPLPAGFTVSDLTISPPRVGPGEPVSISVILTNIGESEGTCRVTLKVNQLVAATRDLTLSGGDSNTVTFNTNSKQPGNYGVDVDGLYGNFNITGLFPLIPVIATGVAVIIVVTAILAWRMGH